MDAVRAEDLPKYISYRKATRTRPPGYTVEKWVYNQWGERRKLTKAFRASSAPPGGDGRSAIGGTSNSY